MKATQLRELVRQAKEALDQFVHVGVIVEGLPGPVWCSGVGLEDNDTLFVISLAHDVGYYRVDAERVIGVKVVGLEGDKDA